jgi:hypothetical protein
MFGFFDNRFTKKPYNKVIFDGNVRYAVTSKIPSGDGDLNLVQYVDDKGKTKVVWLERYYKDGRLMSAAADNEYDTWEYRFDKKGRVDRILVDALWPKLKFVALNAYLRPAKPEDRSYYLRGLSSILIATDRDKKGRVIRGQAVHRFYPKDDQACMVPIGISSQSANISYPKENILRVEFENYGQPWMLPDAWQEWRLEDSGITFEASRAHLKEMIDALKKVNK